MATKKKTDAAVQTLKSEGRSISVVGRDTGMTTKQVSAVASQVVSAYRTCTLMSGTYNALAIKTGGDARRAADKTQVDKDRAALENLFGEDYTFTDPFGVVGNRESTIEAILSGKIRKDSFNYSDETIQVLGDSAITSGVFSMKGSMKVQFRKSGAVRKRDISGRYRTTHTYAKVKGVWKLMSSHMTKEPEGKEKLTRGRLGEADITSE